MTKICNATLYLPQWKIVQRYNLQKSDVEKTKQGNLWYCMESCAYVSYSLQRRSYLGGRKEADFYLQLVIAHKWCDFLLILSLLTPLALFFFFAWSILLNPVFPFVQWKGWIYFKLSVVFEKKGKRKLKLLSIYWKDSN